MWNFLLCAIAIIILGNGSLSQVSDPLPPTSFTCRGRSPGYYADLETGCRIYHVCDGNSHFKYLCPARTLFQQRSRICDHAYLVRCEDAPSFFDEDIYPEHEDEILLRLAESEGQPRTENIDKMSTEDLEFFTTNSPEPREIPTTRPTTNAAATISVATKPTAVATQKFRPESRNGSPSSVNYSSRTNKILKFVIKDFRSLFYIPEVYNNSITIQAEREFSLPVEKKNLLRFRYGSKSRHSFSACPSFCDPKFFLPGTCHPCVLVK